MKDEKSVPIRTPIILACLFVLVATLSGCALLANPLKHRFEEPFPYYLYLPRAYTPDQAWPLFIGVHGSSREGLSCWQTWQPYADEKGYVLLCPELADPNGQLHQLHGNERLLAILGRVYEEVTLQPKIFLAGFSAGAEFVHGYAFMKPSYVVGVSVISPGNFYDPPRSSRHIPFVVMIGDRDDWDSIQSAITLTQRLISSGYSVEMHMLTGVGHEMSEEAIEVTLDHYDLAVGNE